MSYAELMSRLAYGGNTLPRQPVLQLAAEADARIAALEAALPDEAQAEHWRSLADDLLKGAESRTTLRYAALQLQNAIAFNAARAALASTKEQHD